MPPIAASDARANFAEILGRVAYGKERVLIERRGKPVCAVVPVELLAQLDRHIAEHDGIETALEDPSQIGASRGISQALFASLARTLKLFAYRLIIGPTGEPKFSDLAPEFDRLLGLDRYAALEDIQTFFKHLHQEDIAAWRAAVVCALEQGTDLDVTVRLAHPEGDQQVFRFVGQCSSAGEAGCLDGIAMDISEQWQLAAQFEEVSRFLDQILEDSPNEIYVLDPKTYRFLDVNRAARKNLGYDLGELRQMTPKELDPTFDASWVEAEITGSESSAQGPEAFETLNRRKNGSVYPLRIKLRGAHFHGRPILLAIGQDRSEHRHQKEALEGSQARLKAILDNAPAIIYLKDRDGRFTLVNRLFEMTYGVTNEAIAGKTLDEVFPASVRESYASTDREVLSSGQVTERELLDPFDDSGRLLHVIKFPVKDSDGQITAIGGIETNITEIRRNARTLHEKERMVQDQHRILIELAKSKTLASGDLREALKEITEAAVRTLKIGRASVWRFNEDRSKIHCLDLYLPDRECHFDGFELFKEDYPSFFKALEEERTIAATNAQTDPRTCEFAETYLKPLGVTAMLEVPIRIAGEVVGVACHEETGGQRIWTPEEHNFVGSIGDLIALALQVHEHKRAEEAIRDREERFRDIANVASDWFWETDESLCISYVSDRFLEVTGTTLHSILGRTPADVMATDPGDEAFQAHLADLEHRRQFRDYRFETMDSLGRVKIWSVNGNPIFSDPGKFRGYRGSGTDITQQVEMAEGLKAAKEAAELANRAKSEFLANMSHELRTPLNAIIGFSEMISQEVMGPLNNPHYVDYAVDIHDSGTHLLSLINDILDLSKVEAGKTELHEQRIDLREMIKSTLRIIRERLQTAGLRLEIDLMRPVPLIHADLRAMKQILLNLMSNAVKFTPEGGLIRIAAKLDISGSLLLSVSDSGIGISNEDMPTVLAAFGQVESSLNRTHQGTGLGLPLVRSLVELHGGTLEVSSRVGSGTVVTVRIPKERVITSAAAE